MRYETIDILRHLPRGAFLALILLAPAVARPLVPGASASTAGSAAGSDKRDRFIGVYQMVPFGQAIAGGAKAAGTLDDLPLTPEAVKLAASADLRWDPVNNCRVAGPFRAMAMPLNRIELLPSLTGGFFMLFKNASVGNRRQFEFLQKHTDPPLTTFEGESIAHWKGDDLVVDTTGFNDKTWLNGHGAPHDAKLHMTEVYRLLPGINTYLEVAVTVEDAGMLTKPYTYTRYYQRQDAPLGDYYCEESARQN